ncbi:MAG: hypothetical protein M3518_03085 [Actinomycetota bacterium]|nr:hypothetical protein [Actinomycetota bacterium]
MNEQKTSGGSYATTLTEQASRLPKKAQMKHPRKDREEMTERYTNILEKGGKLKKLLAASVVALALGATLATPS